MRLAPRTPKPEEMLSLLQTRGILGCGNTRLHELLELGRKFKGCHPLKGGLYPTYKLSHKNRRVPAAAIARHMEHMRQLEEDAMFRARMIAQARLLGEEVAA